MNPHLARLRLALPLLALACWTSARAADSGEDLTPWNPCPGCNLLLGVGATYKFWSTTGSDVVPIELELDDSRWEIAAFRMTSGQRLDEPFLYPNTTYSARPYWGFSAMRRWRILRRPWGKLYLGFGANYRTEEDQLVAMRWNFAYLISYRVSLGGSPAFAEVSIRHWSDAWLRLPDRGQNFLTVTFGF